MPQTANYIKVKSRRTLRRENIDSLQAIYKAGTSSSLPGGSHMPVGRSVPEGVRMPNSFESIYRTNGGPLTGTTTHTWTPSAGVGQGSVCSPTEVARGELINPAYMPWVGSPRNFDMAWYREQQVSTHQAQLHDNTSCWMPGDVYRSGSTSCERGQTSIGRDIFRNDRIKQEKLSKTRRGRR